MNGLWLSDAGFNRWRTASLAIDHSASMHDIFIFALGATIGGIIAGLWVNINIRWKKARNQMRAPQKVRQELQEKVKKAKGEYNQGWHELRTAFWQLVVLVIFLVICFVVLTNYLAYTP